MTNHYKTKSFCRPRFLLLVTFFIFNFVLNIAYAETFNVDEKSRVEVFLSPRSGSFVEGSTFEVPIFINTNGASVDSINIKINFDKDKLLITQPSSGKSIIGMWVEPPKYDNSKGTISYIGTMPGGIVTESGLIGAITFKALNYGQAVVSIDSNSKILLKDELQTKAVLDLGRAEYNLLKKLSEGVVVFSETHPSEGKWYNNNNAVVSWQVTSGVTGFSFVLDNKPFTVPDNIIDSNENTKYYENLSSGLWYFHIKSLKNNAWGTTGHFILKIDTVPPNLPTIGYNNFLASTIFAGRTFISFFATDNLSGVDHYEVGVIDRSQTITEAPVFIETESPFQVPVLENSSLKIIVRVIDKAGNESEGFIEVSSPLYFVRFITNNFLFIIIILLFILVLFSLRRRNKNSQNPTDTFITLDTNIKKYLIKRKEMNKKNTLEKEKIDILQEDLENFKTEIENNDLK